MVPLQAAQRRKRLGAWYTPPGIVDHVVAATLPKRPQLTVLDPSCGDGRFLAAVAAATAGQVRLVGVDVDEQAVAVAREALPGAEIIHGDALAMDWGDRRFDVVIGNPPYLNQMAGATTRGGSSRFGGGPYMNAAAEFLALATQLAEPDGGRVGLVLPQSVLTTRDAGPVRDEVMRSAVIRSIWWSPTLMFDAQVRVCALILERSASPRQRVVTRAHGPRFRKLPNGRLGASWGSLLVDASSFVAPPSTTATLGDHATINVDFRDQYYGLVGAVGDDVDGPPLITSGLIDPGRCLWGEREVRFAKQRYAAPRVDLSKLTPRLQRWAAQRLIPKILVANQTRVIEAVADPTGSWLPSVPVLSVTSEHLDEVLAVLSSPEATAWVTERAAGSGLSATSMRLNPTLLASIPWPD